MAQERRASLILELKDFVSKNVKSITDVWAGLKLVTEAYNQTLGRVTEFLKGTLDSFSQNESAVNRMSLALKNQGFLTEEYKDHLVSLATQLQDVTTFSDEAVMETMTLLTTFGLAGEKLEETTRAALDLATGLGVDLRTATLLLGKAFDGETSTLSRYGIKVNESLSAAEKFQSVLAQIQSRFGGAAQAETDTYAGKLKQLANSYDDMKESIGLLIVGPATGLVSWLRRASDETRRLIEEVQDWLDLRQKEEARDRVEALQAEVASLEASAASVSRHAAVSEAAAEAERHLTEELKKKRAELDALTRTPGADDLPTGRDAGAADTAALEEKLARESEMEGFAIAERARKKIETLTMTHAEMESMETQFLARDLEAQGMHAEAKNLVELQAKKNAEETTKARMTALGDHLQMIGTLANAKTKALQVIGKIALVNMAIMNTSAGVTQALAFYPPPISFIMGAAVAAAGAVQIARIAGIDLAEGGMLTARSGGVHARLAEAGKDEVAIPLDDERTKERLADTFEGRGGDTYVFQIGTMVADEMGLDMLAQKIDEKLFRLKRNKRSVVLDG